MHAIAELVAAGDPVDPDLVLILAEEGLYTLEAIHALGREHIVDIFANRAGFKRDFIDLPHELELSWASAATAARFQCPPYEMEIGVCSWVVLDKLGCETFADAFKHSPQVVKTAMAERSGMLLELYQLLERHQMGW